jgi:hypothetical protein
MIIELNKNASKSEITKALKRIRWHIRRKKKDPFKYFGKITLDFDPVKWQKNIRNDWD